MCRVHELRTLTSAVALDVLLASRDAIVLDDETRHALAACVDVVEGLSKIQASAPALAHKASDKSVTAPAAAAISVAANAVAPVRRQAWLVIVR
jgi:hypothetical protein